jgi:hypothetical protein
MEKRGLTVDGVGPNLQAVTSTPACNLQGICVSTEFGVLNPVWFIIVLIDLIVIQHLVLLFIKHNKTYLRMHCYCYYLENGDSGKRHVPVLTKISTKSRS